MLIRNSIRHLRSAPGLAAAALLALAIAAPAGAADGNAEQTPGDGSGQSVQPTNDAGDQKPITDDELKKFAAAYNELLTIRRDYQGQLQEAESKDDRESLKQEGQEEMVSAIRDEGMKLAEYKRIGQRLQNDKALQERFQKIRQAEQGGTGTGNGGGSGSGN